MVVLMIGLLGLVGLPGQADDAGILVRILVTVLAVGVLFATLRVARLSRTNERRVGVLLGGVMLVVIVGFLLTSDPVYGKVISFVWVLLVLTAPALVLRQVLASNKVTVQTILGSITVYLLIGVALTFVAIALEQSLGFFEVAPRSTAYVYFAFITITTVGYGDLAPYTDLARILSVGAAVSAQMYLVIVVARLVSIWKPDVSEGDSGDEQ